MIKVITYQPEHLEKLDLQDSQKSESSPVIHGQAITFMKDETVLAIVGGFMFGTQVLQGWALISSRVSSNRFGFHKTVKMFIPYIMERLGVQRLQISVLCGNMVAWKWARSLGFECEGIMRKYGPEGADYWLFARCMHERR